MKRNSSSGIHHAFHTFIAFCYQMISQNLLGGALLPLPPRMYVKFDGRDIFRELKLFSITKLLYK
jgi:hypothetical protein